MDNDIHKYSLYRYFMAGTIIRFLLMPFFFMEGLFYSYRRSAILLFSPDTGIDIQQLILESLQSIYLLVIKNFIPFFENLKNIFLMEDGYQAWYSFSTDDNIFRTLFIFKFLFFIFDIIGAFLIIKLFKDKTNRIRAFKYWMFNPVLIFVVYMIGRLDVIPVVLMILAFYLAKIGSKKLSFFIFLLTVFMRFFPLLILPLFIGYIVRKKRDHLIYWGISLLIFILIELSMWLVFDKSLFITIISSYHFRFSFLEPIGIFPFDKIIIFVLAYFCILFFYFRSKHKSFNLFVKYSAIIYLVFFTISTFYPQYFLWIIPLLIILFINDKRLIILHIFQFVFLLFLVPFWWKWPYSNDIFVPIDFDFFNRFPNLAEITEISFTAPMFENIFRIIFVSINISMIAFVVYSITKKKTLENEKV